MKKSNLIIVFIALILVGLITAGIIYVLQYMPDYSWRISLNSKSDQPYGTKFFHDILLEQTGKENFKTLISRNGNTLDNAQSNALYMLVGQAAFYDSITAEKLINFIRDGNEAFIATYSFPNGLAELIFEKIDSISHYKKYETSLISVSTTQSSNKYSFHFQYLKDTAKYYWSYLDTDLSDIDSYLYFKALGYLDSSKVNYFRARVGAGKIYFLSTPILLTNYYLSKPKGLEYTNSLLGYLKPYDKIIWDESSKIPDFTFHPTVGFSNNPIYFILSKPGLRWAWYLSLAAVLMYMLFAMKRRQRPIPLMPQNKNTSVEFARAVGTLYYSHKNHQKLANDLMQLFLAFIRNRYQISTKAEQDVLAKQIALKSEVGENKILSILKEGFAIRYNPDPDSEEISRLHNQIEEFYKTCK